MYMIYDARTNQPLSSQRFSTEDEANFAAMQLSKCYPDKLLVVKPAH